MSAPPSPQRRAAPPALDPNVDAIPWVAEGVAAGVLGAAVVAVFFGLVDVVASRPFWTPFELGSEFLRGRLPAPGDPVDAVLVMAYTAMHGAVFLSVGLIAAFLLLSGSRPPGPVTTRGLVLAGFLFAAFEVVFSIFGWLFAPRSMALLGAGSVALANGLAAAAMAGFLCARAERALGPGGR
jgi:hypothetical protein